MARSKSRRTSQVLRACTQGASVAHAAVPGVVGQGQLRAEQEEEAEKDAAGERNKSVVVIRVSFPLNDGSYVLQRKCEKVLITQIGRKVGKMGRVSFIRVSRASGT